MGDWDWSENVARGLGSTTAARRHTCLIRGPPDSDLTPVPSLPRPAPVASPASFLLGSDIGDSDETILGGEAETAKVFHSECLIDTIKNRDDC